MTRRSGAPAMIHVDGYAARTPTVFSAAASEPQLALALSLVRLGQQAARSEFRIFHYVQALKVLEPELKPLIDQPAQPALIGSSKQ